MDTDIVQRLAIVETKVGTLQTTVDSMATDVRTIRDHVVKEKAIKADRNRLLTVVGGVLATLGTVWGVIEWLAGRIHFS